MIVGTAGHIDHGKTTLVQALTGVNTDRLPEEQRRGVSIELGYAFLEAPGGERLGFIDVPGHERLVHTMLSGATGIDYALLLVAADDGVMPQTREHLAVLSLLGLHRGEVLITKSDRADAQRLQAVEAEVQALLVGTALEGAPIHAVSAVSGMGMEALRGRLLALSAAEAGSAPAEAAASPGFRLAIDRAFTLTGTGTVLTGTIHAGSVSVGDELEVVPPPASGARRVRVRSVHAQNRRVEHAVAGQRCALAVAGLDKESAERGAWLVDPRVAQPSDRIDVTLQLWRDEAKALRSGTTVHVHLGAVDVMASVALLDAETLAPGATALAQLVLHRPIGAWHGDRVVLRDASGSRTVAGGRVLDTAAPTRYRRTPQRLAYLRSQTLPTLSERMQAAVAQTPQGLEWRHYAARQGWVELLSSGAALPVPESTLRLQGEAEGSLLLAPEHALALRTAAEAVLAQYHERHPEELGPDMARWRRLAAPRSSETLWKALVRVWLEQGWVRQRGACVHLPAHGVQLSNTEERLSEKVAPLLAAAGFEGAWVRDLARDTQESEPLMRVTLSRLAQQGRLHQVVRDLFYPTATVEQLIRLVHEAAQRHGGDVTAAQYRDATGLGRKRAIQILEYLDRVGVLRRLGDLHRLRSDSALLHTAIAPIGSHASA